ncbi:MAG: NAD-dependent epimerase/dehydratase family protein [Planctomycetaceae bacterium]|nr:MAG: NAD-dependent epimerase/dehydratase family protein [Planctomycetaceae bacterium]
MLPAALPHPPLPLLVTGIAGVAGYNAFLHFRSLYPGRVIGVRRVDNWPLRGPGIAACDLHDHDALCRLFDRYRFAAILNCEGTCKLKSCELDPWLAWRVNVIGVQNLLEVIDRTDVRLIHLSVDLVYSGDTNRPTGYQEDDPPDPVTIYGKTMVQAERLILAERSDACILRISLPMGKSFNGHAGAIDWIESRFRKGKPVTLLHDEIRTPTFIECLNRVFQAVLVNRMSGVFHAGGPRRLSLYQIGEILQRRGRFDSKLLIGCYRDGYAPVPPRAGNVTMDSSRLAAALGYRPFAAWPEDQVGAGSRE